MREEWEGKWDFYDGQDDVWLIPGFVPPPRSWEGFGAPSSLYQLLSGDGSLCMAFFFMLSRYSCCDTARTEAKISSSSQSVSPFIEQENTLAGKEETITATKKNVHTSCGFHSHPTRQPLFPLLASFLCSFLLRSRAEWSGTTGAYEVNQLSLLIFPFHTISIFPPTVQKKKIIWANLQNNYFIHSVKFSRRSKCENCHCTAVWLGVQKISLENLSKCQS